MRTVSHGPRGLSLDELEADDTLRRAFVRSLEVIGEAPKKVPEDLRARHPQVDWRATASMRERLIHGKFGEAPDACAAHAYDGTRMLVAVIREAGLNRLRIRDALAAHLGARA